MGQSTRFKDEKGREWDLTITVATVRRVQNACGVNLLDAVAGELVSRLAGDIMLLADVLWAIVEPQAKAAGVDDLDFGEGLLGDALDHATGAFMEGLRGFFARPGQRKLIGDVIDKINQAMSEAETVGSERMSRIDAKAVVREAAKNLPPLPGSSE